MIRFALISLISTILWSFVIVSIALSIGTRIIPFIRNIENFEIIAMIGIILIYYLKKLWKNILKK
jgi:membrane protein DedA with SNARE-associated domain